MKKLFFIVAMVFAFSAAYSQSSYKSAIGLRFGYPTSISFKTFVSDKAAFEAFVGYRRYASFVNYLTVGALYEVHTPITGVDGLSWYYGGGASVIFWNYDDVYFRNDEFKSLNLGIMGVLGLDFKFPNAPVNLSVDWVPTFIIGNAYNDGFRGDAGALSARYTFR